MSITELELTRQYRNLSSVSFLNIGFFITALIAKSKNPNLLYWAVILTSLALALSYVVMAVKYFEDSKQHFIDIFLPDTVSINDSFLDRETPKVKLLHLLAVCLFYPVPVLVIILDFHWGFAIASAVIALFTAVYHVVRYRKLKYYYVELAENAEDSEVIEITPKTI